jgi:hypothetical protein
MKISKRLGFAHVFGDSFLISTSRQCYGFEVCSQ